MNARYVSDIMHTYGIKYFPRCSVSNQELNQKDKQTGKNKFAISLKLPGYDSAEVLFFFNTHMHIYIYTFTYMSYVCVYTYIHIISIKFQEYSSLKK